jgi:hypothetical protein
LLTCNHHHHHKNKNNNNNNNNTTQHNTTQHNDRRQCETLQFEPVQPLSRQNSWDELGSTAGKSCVKQLGRVALNSWEELR